MNEQIRIRGFIKHMEVKQAIFIVDEDGRRYIWTGTELYRCRLLANKKTKA